MKTSQSNPHVVIIGAGPAGLATAKAMLDAGFTVSVFEKNNDVGGIWNPAAENSPMYNSAHFIASIGLWTSHFEGFPFPPGTPHYPSNLQVFNYLKSFAEAENLYKYIEFDTQVTNISPIGQNRWQIEASSRTFEADVVIVCSGTLWTPVTPHFPGEFDGSVRHAQTYKDPSEFEGKNVLIVGCGNSGVDIACDAARTAKSTYLSMRRGYWFFPKFVMGQPLSEFFASDEDKPEWMAGLDFPKLLELVAGDPSKFGLPRPDHAPLASHPIMNSEILHHFGHGRISPRGEIEKLDGRKVLFESGEVDQIDEIICATGYQTDLPFLADNLVEMNGGTRPDLLMTAFHPSAANLYFNGMIETNGGVFGLFSKLANLLASIIAARAEGRLSDAELSRMVTEADAISKTPGKIQSARHVGYVDTALLVKAMMNFQSQLHPKA
ncbi:NAD(P)/FAD-dependent oxidoreductase [Sphingorhabdus sp. EL138]|uniref:flavin-containing monooxygenase n=1 Tax=Sphingorhabdus sp. EL138 TaxID=2073156 RepID=UPI000D69C50C|nr:NAD(P)-binding domain-containing protein [Sphingorhabdus sp. EL138]